MSLAVKAIHPGSVDGELAYQARLLPGVSRTFALTIPRMPPPVSEQVTNAYLLCRIADTIEDDRSILPGEKDRLLAEFVRVVEGQAPADAFARSCLGQLSGAVLPAERDLVANTARVVALTHGFEGRARAAIERCVRIMSEGMARFARRRSTDGLADVQEMNDYCYVVAGCVGEMLTDLFAAYSTDIGRRHGDLFPMARSFGQGLQMTNILKDIWEDRADGACWLPRTVFAAHGIDLSVLPEGRDDPGFARGIRELIGIAHGHLANSMRYTHRLPKYETGIRDSCLWPIGLAMLTLRRINANPHFSSGAEVKVSRRAVRGVVLTSRLLGRSTRGLSLAFALAGRGLPPTA